MGPSAEELIRRALTRRRADEFANVRRGAGAFRILNGLGDDVPGGLTLDQFDRWLVLSAREQVGAEVVERYQKAAQTVIEADGLVFKNIKRRAGQSTSEVLWGEVPEDEIWLSEDRARLGVELNRGAQTGVFLDHRETRRRVGREARGHRVLNLFAYTCAFSVHAALGGAIQTTSVDVSRRALRRGRKNFTASGLDPDQHRWFDDDVMRFVKRPAAPEYDVIVADPPVMGRAKNRTFSLLKALPELLRGVLQRLQPGGLLVFSTHALELDQHRLAGELREAAVTTGRTLGELEFHGLPHWDHPAQDGTHDRGDYLLTVITRVS